MRRGFKAGDRVRLTAVSESSGDYLPCRGTVLSGKEASLAGWQSYYVRMDGQAIGTWIVLSAGEIEAEELLPAEGLSLASDEESIHARPAQDEVPLTS